jgi:hypothetical protein
MYGRHKVFNVFAQGVKNLRIAYPEVEINVLVVGSGDRKAVEKHGFEYHDFPNFPLTKKAQHRLTLSKNKADYYLFLGSDDLIDERMFGYYLKQIKNGYDLIAPYDIHLYNKGRMYYSEGYSRRNPRHGEALAVGRCLSNRLLESFKWVLWEGERNKGLDGAVWKKLKKTVRKRLFYSKNLGIIMDIKTHENISKFKPKNYKNRGLVNRYLNKNLIRLLNDI